MRLTSPSLAAAAYVCGRLRDGDREEAFALRWDDDADALAMDTLRWGKLSWAVYDDALPVALLGATQLHPNVWSAWMLATDQWPRVALGVTKFIKRRMIPHLMESGATRCEARSIDGHTKAHRWLEALGAVQEARLRRYGRNGEDFLVFRWDAHVL